MITSLNSGLNLGSPSFDTMKNFEFREITNTENFDPNSICANVPFTQAGFYGDWQEKLGRKARRFLIHDGKEAVAYFQLIKYPLLLGKSYFYIPYGPVTKNRSEEFFAGLKEKLEHIAREDEAVFVRLDFTPPISNEILAKYFTEAPPYTYHSAYFQPRREWFLGLERPEDELLKEMHEKTRYSIRLAERKGTTAEIITGDFEGYFEIFYELMSITSKRNSFSLHPKDYYKNIFKNLSKAKNSYLSVAKYNQAILSIYLIIPFGGIANYVFGCSSNEEKNRMPTYLAHWKAICHAKRLNCIYYNFGGVDAEGRVYKNLSNLTIFKKKFGGKEMTHSDFFDIVTSPFWYRLYNFRKYIKEK